MVSHKTLLVVLLTVALCVVQTAVATPVRHTVERRAVGPTLAAPSGWKVSFNVDGKRVSNGASTSFISLFTVDKTATSVSQAHLNSCVARCSTTSKCAYVNLVKMTGSSLGNVVCMLFPKYLASTSATYTTGPQSSGGTVDYSYGIRSLCAPTNGASPTCTPQVVTATTTTAPVSTPTTTTTTKITTTTTKAMTTTTTKTTSTSTTTSAQPTVSNAYFSTSNTANLPAAPSGATLVQWKPCKGSARTVPAMVNALALSGSSSISTGYVVQHGSEANFDSYFTFLQNVVGSAYPIISPGFFTTDSTDSFYQSGTNMAWAPGNDTWSVGEDDATGGQCSSFDMYDSMINYLATSGAFPNLKTIYLVGHSRGSNLLSRFSTINTNNPVTIRYVIANAANNAYFTDARPTKADLCNDGQTYVYPYQWTGSFNRYVSARISSPSALFSRWIQRPVTFLIGDMDTTTDGTQNCASQRQGEYFRRDRNYAYWAYQNILAGTGKDVSAFYGYGNLTAQGASTLASGSFNHQECTAAGVPHSPSQMFSSDCGRAAILGQSLPAGAGASYP